MADDGKWQVGDLALCVMSEDDYWEPGPGPARGSVNRVSSVQSLPLGNTGLKFDGWPASGVRAGYHSSYFRRIAPHAPDAEDAETIRLLAGVEVRA